MDFPRVFFVALTVFVCFLGAPCNAQGNDEKAKEAVAACSVFGAAYSNANAWNSGDFLFRDQTSFDTVRSTKSGEPFGVTIEDVVYQRVVFDVEKGQYIFLSFQKERVLDIGNERLSGPDSKENIVMTGWYINALTDRYLRFTETGYVSELKRESLPREIESLLLKIQFPQVRGFWLTQSLSTSMERFGGMIDNRKAGKHFSSSSSDGGHEIVKFKMVRDELGEKNASHCEKFRFDSQSLMPVSYRAYIELKNEVVKGTTGEFKWADFDGVYVPVVFKWKRPTTLVVNNKAHDGLSYHDLNFHWFSLNKPDALPKGILDASCFENREAFMKFVDPVLAGAESLLEEPSPEPVEKSGEK